MDRTSAKLLPAINASSSRTVRRVAGPSYGGMSIRFYQLIWLRLTTTTHSHRRDPDSLSPLLYLLSYLCCQRRLFGSHPCPWALVLVTRGFCQPATTHVGREHTRVKHRVSRTITLLVNKLSYHHQWPHLPLRTYPVHIRNPKPQTKTSDDNDRHLFLRHWNDVHSTLGYAGFSCSLGLEMRFGVKCKM